MSDTPAPGVLAALDQEIANNGAIVNDIVGRVKAALGSRDDARLLADLSVTLRATYSHSDVAALAAEAIMRLARDTDGAR